MAHWEPAALQGRQGSLAVLEASLVSAGFQAVQAQARQAEGLVVELAAWAHQERQQL